MKKIQEKYRNIPPVDKLLDIAAIKAFIPVLGRNIVLDIIREEILKLRELLKTGTESDPAGLESTIIRRCMQRRIDRLQRVINGTGVIIHTNLGRAPLGKQILYKLADTLSGYCNLELHLPDKKRGRRGGFAEELLCSLTSAEDALIVNNNAASVFLILKHFGEGREVVVSRGELVQIGGGFRIPDIMNQTGACLVEVGTTNITTLEDYAQAIGDRTSMIFSAHRSNFTMEGFSSMPDLRELASLKKESILLVRDLGSGNLVYDKGLGEDFESTVFGELSQGADLLCFSGDKLLGACQAGIIVGRRNLIAQLRKNPLMRMIRVDKTAYFLLQETLLQYVNGSVRKIALWNMILQDIKTIDKRIARLFRMIKNPNKKVIIKKISLRGTYGGGSMPTREIESRGIQLDIPGMTAEEIGSFFASRQVPVIGYIAGDSYILDFLTVFDEDIPDLAASVNEILEPFSGGF